MLSFKFCRFILEGHSIHNKLPCDNRSPRRRIFCSKNISTVKRKWLPFRADAKRCFQTYGSSKSSRRGIYLEKRSKKTRSCLRKITWWLIETNSILVCFFSASKSCTLGAQMFWKKLVLRVYTFVSVYFLMCAELSKVCKVAAALLLQNTCIHDLKLACTLWLFEVVKRERVKDGIATHAR